MASIAVVGAGVAGLACAWRLARVGHDVQVLEREETPGGRARTERRGEFVIDRGASVVARGDRSLAGLARAVGAGGRLRPLVRDGQQVLHRGRLLPAELRGPLDLVRSTLLTRREKTRLWRVGLALARTWRRIDPSRPELLAGLDGEDLAGLLRRTGAGEALERLLQPILSARLDAQPEETSAAFVWSALRAWRQGGELQAFDGGIGVLIRSLAESVPVRTGCEAIRVETAEDGARVHYRTLRSEGSLLADAVVMAVPGTRIPFLCARLTPAERGFFDRVRYGRGILVWLLLDKEPAELPAHRLVFPRAEGLELRELTVDHRKLGAAPRGTALLRVALAEEASARLWWAQDEAVTECALDALARTPVGRLAPGEAIVQRWDPLLPRFAAGHLARLQAFLGRRERSPRLAFAGDYLVGPSLDMAVTSGMRAATEVARGLAPQAGRSAR